jgi:hypothetical protein
VGCLSLTARVYVVVHLRLDPSTGGGGENGKTMTGDSNLDHLRWAIEIVDGDRAALRFTQRGKRNPDMPSLLMQLGVFPAPGLSVRG